MKLNQEDTEYYFQQELLFVIYITITHGQSWQV